MRRSPPRGHARAEARRVRELLFRRVGTLLGPGDQSSDTLVKIYLARLEAMTDQPEQYVQGEMVIDPPGLIALAKQSGWQFETLNEVANSSARL